MDDDKSYKESLAFFSTLPHDASFEVLRGRGDVVFSAPHAVTQTRDGREKPAERYTGVLLQLLHQRVGCTCIYKTRNLGDDANHDAQSDYRDTLCELMRKQNARYLLDLHQLKPEREMALCIGTGRGRNLCGDERCVPVVEHAFSGRSLTPVTLDDPFAAAGAHTVSATVSARLGIPALQLELNTRLLQEGYSESNFDGVLQALIEIAHRLSK